MSDDKPKDGFTHVRSSIGTLADASKADKPKDMMVCPDCEEDPCECCPEHGAECPEDCEITGGEEFW